MARPDQQLASDRVSADDRAFELRRVPVRRAVRRRSRVAPVYPEPMGPRFYVAHGASGSAASMAAHVRGLTARGVDAVAIDLPLTKAEDAVPAFRAIVPDGPAAPGASGRGIAVGGQSYGGRVATLAAALPATAYAGVVCFSFPLHPPGSPAKAEERTQHFPDIRCPVLFLSGESDPFATLALLRERIRLIPNAELVTYAKLGHTLKPVLDDALDRAARFLLALG
jgi:predicted alpha/beta-hydrolase family hydrolase